MTSVPHCVTSLTRFARNEQIAILSCLLFIVFISISDVAIRVDPFNSGKTSYVLVNTILCKIIKDINIWIWYNRGQKNKYKSQCIEISIKDYVFKLRAIKV